MAHAAQTEVSHAHAEGHGAHEHHGSFMPLILTVGATLLLLGGLWPVLAIPGALILAASVVGWIREDVLELKKAPFHSGGRSPYWMGTVFLILSELVIFGALFFFYFWSRAHAEVWPAEQIAHINMTPIIVNTVILLSSSVTVHVAEHALEHGKLRRFQIWLGITVALGAIFLLGQLNEYRELIHEGMTPQVSAFATAFYSLTGVHGLHVFAGVIAMATIFGLSFTGFITKERASGVSGAFLYWHFVDLVWVFVFSIVYLRLI